MWHHHHKSFSGKLSNEAISTKTHVSCQFYKSSVLSLVFLFIVRLRFRSGKSIASVIRSRYNGEIVKQIRRFEKLDFKIRKNEADLDFYSQELFLF